MTTKIVDNILDQKEADAIEKELMSVFFPWYYQDSVSDKFNTNDFYFTHILYENLEQSSYFNLIIPILKKIKYKKLIRVKANLYPGFDKKVIHPKHVDYTYNTNGAIYYVNTNNGTTNLTNKKIESVKNRLLYFNASKPHNSTTCTDKKIRLNININYL